VPCPPGLPLRKCDSPVITLLGVSHWGEPGGGGETLANVRVFKNISDENELNKMQVME